MLKCFVILGDYTQNGYSREIGRGPREIGVQSLQPSDEINTQHLGFGILIIACSLVWVHGLLMI